MAAENDINPMPFIEPGNELNLSATLVIFTCENREHLLLRTLQSFKENCAFKFQKIILAVDGPFDPAVITAVNPDMVIQHNQRRGYVNSISKAVKLVDTPYFFWLEDDWSFKKAIRLEDYLKLMQQQTSWAEIVWSQFGPLSTDFKSNPLGGNLYQTTFGFSANPCICNTQYLQAGFELLALSPKGDKLGTDGFENFLTRTFEGQNLKCVIIDPVDHLPIAHEGYLESTPRNWHMTNSLEEKTAEHLLIFPKPSLLRRLLMVLKLLTAFFKLTFTQLVNNKVYELCFRIIALSKSIKND